MTVKGATGWAGAFVCKDATGALAAASVGPAGVLYLNGTANGASITISGANPYKWTLILPALSAGDYVQIYITATVGGIATAAFVAADAADTKRISDLNDIAATAVVSGGAITTAAGVASANMVQINGDATNDNLATLRLRELHIVQDGNGPGGIAKHAVHIEQLTNNDAVGINVDYTAGDSGAYGLGIYNNANYGNGVGIEVTGVYANAVDFKAAHTDALLVQGGDAGAGILVTGGATGNGISITTTNGDGINVASVGAGKYDINADIHGTVDTATSVTNVVSANLVQILGTVLTETAGQIAAAFRKFFNVAAPTGTVNSIPDALPSAASGLPLKSDLPAAAPDVNAIADQVWNEAIAGHLNVGSTGLALNTAGSASDPLNNPVPGAYPAGSAGNVIGGLQSGRITFVSPMSQDGLAVKLVRGDDYLNADGRALVWTDSGSNWPNLTGATVRFKWVTFTKTCTVIGAGGAHQQVSLDLTSAETDVMQNGYFDIEATLSNTHVVTIVVAGSLIIRDDV